MLEAVIRVVSNRKKSLTEQKKSPKAEILPISGAGEDATDTLVNNYKNDTPGQGLKSFKDYKSKK
jgi:hypothetical protein